MRAFLLGLLLLATALAGCGDPPADDVQTCPGGCGPPPAAGTGLIRGVVVDQRVMPVVGAVVSLVGTEQAQVTDQAGAFEFRDVSGGEHFLTVAKPGYQPTQATASVQAGLADPPVLRVLMERLIGQEPSIEVLKFEGFFECGFALPFITDSCDFGVRTVADAANESGVGGLPRGVQRNENTVFYEVADSVAAVVQEGVWENPEVAAMMILLSSTPIDNACDCSDRDYLEVVGPSPTYGYIEGDAVPKGETVAARGFLPFGDAQVALNHEFTVFTTLFHHAAPGEGWSFVNGDGWPF